MNWFIDPSEIPDPQPPKEPRYFIDSDGIMKVLTPKGEIIDLRTLPLGHPLLCLLESEDEEE